MPCLRLVYAVAAAVLPLLNVIDTLRPVPVLFGPQTHDDYRNELWEDVFAQETFGSSFQDVWGAINSVLGLAINPRDLGDPPSTILAPTPPVPRPHLASRAALNITLPSAPSSTCLVESSIRVGSLAHAHPLSILPTIVLAPPSAAYVILGYVLLGGILFSLFVLAAVILALRWAMASASSNTKRALATRASLRPSGIPRWVPRVVSSLDAVGELSSSSSYASILPVVEKLQQSIGMESVTEVQQFEILNSALVVDSPEIADGIQECYGKNDNEVEQPESGSSTLSADTSQLTPVTPTFPAGEATPLSSPISDEPATPVVDRSRVESAPGAIIYQTAVAPSPPASPAPGSIMYETPTAISQVSTAPSLIIYQTPLAPRKPAVLDPIAFSTSNHSYHWTAPRPTSYYSNAPGYSSVGSNGRPSILLPSAGPEPYYLPYAPAPGWSRQAYADAARAFGCRHSAVGGSVGVNVPPALLSPAPVAHVSEADVPRWLERPGSGLGSRRASWPGSSRTPELEEQTCFSDLGGPDMARE
ncbi:hypothetical protein C8R45DRAFT_945819 [Mycena sanguinolenta]|nr:hypothetical protein C8R45DRAFT_945819 [Mycena sanguinolenta]